MQGGDVRHGLMREVWVASRMEGRLNLREVRPGGIIDCGSSVTRGGGVVTTEHFYSCTVLSTLPRAALLKGGGRRGPPSGANQDSMGGIIPGGMSQLMAGGQQ
jgi:hypothetical protein